MHGAVAIAGAVAANALAPQVRAAEPPDVLARCAEIGAPADRLVCYDKLAGRALAPQPAGDAKTGTPASTSALVPKDAPAPAAGGGIGPEPSLLARFWELDADDKRGTFNFTGYRPNYVLPLHATNRVNRAPSSPTQPAVLLPNYKDIEAKFQLSLRTKVAQDLLLPQADVWLAFTQQALWQIWNSADSKPFRNSDYEPEVIYVVPTGQGLRSLPLGWTWRYTQLGLAHQSNGQADPLSRSWNRVYGALGFERGDWAFLARFVHRLGEGRASDNNPDLLAYRGRYEFTVNWAAGNQTASMLLRTNLKDKRGGVQLDWTTPVFRDRPNGLRWYVQLFHGYAETLTDYNFRQTSLGLGVSFLQF